MSECGEKKQRWEIGKINGKEHVLYEAIEHYSLETQMTKAIEECGELIVAIARGDIPNIAEEVADVRIMLDQIEIILGLDTGMIRQSKLERLSQRIQEEKQNAKMRK
jgi:NTP pyrophosphatase (non-canonical NTP hydrolase)